MNKQDTNVELAARYALRLMTEHGWGIQAAIYEGIGAVYPHIDNDAYGDIREMLRVTDGPSLSSSTARALPDDVSAEVIAESGSGRLGFALPERVRIPHNEEGQKAVEHLETAVEHSRLARDIVAYYTERLPPLCASSSDEEILRAVRITLNSATLAENDRSELGRAADLFRVSECALDLYDAHKIAADRASRLAAAA